MDNMQVDYPLCWDVVRNWQDVLPASPLRDQQYSHQCWNLSVADCVKDVAFLEKNPLPDEISNSEIRDWLPHVKIYFNMSENPPAHAVNSKIWPPYDKANGCGASMPHIFQYLKCFGTHFKKAYKYEQHILANNFSMFSMEEFMHMRTSFATERVFISTYRLITSQLAIPVVKNKHPVVGTLFASYREFIDYKPSDILSPIRPVNEKTKLPHLANHMVYIIGYGFVKKGEEKIECFLIRNTWGESWGFYGLAMVPVSLFSHVAYPKGVKVRESHIIIDNDLSSPDAERKVRVGG